jgi:hypothetical protein
MVSASGDWLIFVIEKRVSPLETHRHTKEASNCPINRAEPDDIGNVATSPSNCHILGQHHANNPHRKCASQDDRRWQYHRLDVWREEPACYASGKTSENGRA